MLRTGSIVAACLLLAILLGSQLFPSDRDRVEKELKRLVDVVRKGGPDAADEVLDAFADDYRGTMALDDIRGRLIAVRNGVPSLRIGKVKSIWDGDEIVIPLLRVSAKGYGTGLVTITWAERDGEWKITSFKRARWGN